MTASEVAAAAHAAGLQLSLDGRVLVVKPADLITSELRSMLTSTKGELVQYLAACERITPALLVIAMRVCDDLGDSEAGRAEMRADLLATPLFMRIDLMHHFQQT